jgi:hypothetical protein
MSRGLDVWWDKDIKPGEDWTERIHNAMNSSCAVLVCLSSQLAHRSRSWVYREILDAIAALRETRPGSIFLIPVRLSKCEIPPIEIDGSRTLKSLQYVDLFPAKNWKSGVDQLVAIIRSLRARS